MKRILAAALCLIAALTAGASAAVTVGGLRYSIVNVYATSSVGDVADGLGSKADGEFIVLRLRVANVGSSSAMISASDFHLQRNHVSYDAASSASMYVSDPFFLKTVNPGVSATGTIVFDVPPHTSPSSYFLEVFGNGGITPHFIQL